MCRRKSILWFWAVFFIVSAICRPCVIQAQVVYRTEHLTLKDGLSHRWAYDISQDKLGYIWIGTFDGINRYDGHRFTVYRPYFPEFPDMEAKLIAQVDCLPTGETWATSKQGILMRLNLTEDRFELVWPEGNRKFPLKGRPLFSPQRGYAHGLGLMGADNSSQEWFAHMTSSSRFDSITALRPPLFLRKQIIPLLDEKNFWVYADKDYAILNLESKSYQAYRFTAIPGAVVAHPVLPIDAQSRFWYPAPEGGFRYFMLPASIPVRNWDQFKLDNKGNFWIWTRDKRTFRYLTQSDVLEDFGIFDFWEYEFGSPFEDREGNIWIPHFYGVTKLVMQRRLFENYLHLTLNALGAAPGGKSVYTMREGEDGVVYIKAYGTPTFQLAPNAKTPEPTGYDFPNVLPGDAAVLEQAKKKMGDAGAGSNVQEDPIFFHDSANKTLWISRRSATGIFRMKLNPSNDIRFFPLSESAQIIITLVEADGYLWAGTDNGLYRLQPQNGDIRHYTTREGLPHQIVYSILPDGPALWLGTHNGLCRFDPRSGETKNYYVEDGLTHNEFNTRSALKARDGKLYFGGLNGVNAFYPAELERTSPRRRPGLYLNRFSKLDGRKDTLTAMSAYDLQPLDAIRLHPSDRSFTFEFFINSYANSAQNKYLYFLDGWEQPWSNETNDGRAFYPHLPPGKYTLRVKAADPFGNETADEIALPLVMPQVWYLRWWAWCIYAAILLGAGRLLYRIRLRQHLQHREALRMKELDEVKTRLYTNITHEFRTPLTVILGMTEKLMGDGENGNDEAPLAMIKRNGENLLNLVNQMLDLAKLESGKLSLLLVQADVVHYLRYVAASFHSFAQHKNIELHFLPEPDSCFMDFDKDRLLHIVSNLLSNAVKFTETGGHIYVQTAVAGERFLIKVKDTGAGIPEDKLPHIFERFYQVDDSRTRKGEGTGIGLTLVHELVKMMGGDINVKSRLGHGTEFTISLPVTRNAPIAGDAPSQSPVQGHALLDTVLPYTEPVEAATDDTQLPLLLVVEDNADVAEYIGVCLAGLYRILYAADGKAGIEKALAEIPDLIVSDVMMPERDGFELVQTLRQDERTNHIPIVLLTAKADIASKLEGLERGADAYLPKPFHQKELQLRLRNLLEKQRRMQEKFAGKDFGALQTQPYEKAAGPQGAFLQEAAHAILDRLDDAEFGNEELARRMAMSESQLNRKIKALTGKTLSIFIRSVRLREGLKLLQTTNLNVSEVAYAVGFTDPAYFSRTFSQEFGKAPSAYRN